MIAGGEAAEAPALALTGIDKWFGSVHANRAVSLSIPRGTIHGIMGENGAGVRIMFSCETSSPRPALRLFSR